MSLLLPSYRPFLRSLPRSLLHRLPATAVVSRSLLARSFQTPSSTSPNLPPKFAFAFDIDGVLMHGSTPIENAKTALSTLSQKSIEYILLTNGGGKSEAARTADLSAKLNVPIHPSQLIQSHTPFAALAKKFNTVLVVGGEGDNCRHLAKEYGFQNVILPCDVLAAYPALSPFSVDKAPAHAQPLPEGEIKFDAILVFNDPRDWALDLQLILDILLSEEGRLGTRRDLSAKSEHVPLYFSNPDLVWANEYHIPRLGQGSFKAALIGVWRFTRALGNYQRLNFVSVGKPNTETYEFAEEVLCSWRKAQLKKAGVAEEHPDVQTVYMIGDNPKSDIRGANDFESPKGIKWVSILVKTGVFRDRERDSKPAVIVDDVLAAVNWAIEREENLLLNPEANQLNGSEGGEKPPAESETEKQPEERNEEEKQPEGGEKLL